MYYGLILEYILVNICHVRIGLKRFTLNAVYPEICLQILIPVSAINMWMVLYYSKENDCYVISKPLKVL